jgi:hypothetical protein
MNCPHCKTPNNPGSQFCIQCGENLSTLSPAETNVSSKKELLGILTIRMVVSLIGLMIVNSILIGLAFVQELNIPDFDIPTPTLISILIYLVAIGILINYASTLRNLWPKAFPKYAQAAFVFNALITLILLSMAYRIIKPIIRGFTNDATPFLITQSIFVVIALITLGRASAFVFQMLPSWIANLKAGILPVPMNIEKEGDAEVDQ